MAGLALPFLWVGSRHGTRTAAGAALALALVVALTAVAFGDALWPALTAFLQQGHFVSLRSFPGQLSDAILERRTIPAAVRYGAIAGFASVTLALLVRSWRAGDWITNLGWAMLCLLLALTRVMPCYLLWVLPFAALTHNRRLRHAALGLGLFLLVVRMPSPPAL